MLFQAQSYGFRSRFNCNGHLHYKGQHAHALVLLTAEAPTAMLPNPSLHLAGGAAGAKPQPQPQHTHLADVLLLHVLPGGELQQPQQQPGSGWLGGGGELPSLAAVQDLEQRARSFFGPSRFNQPGVKDEGGWDG